MRIRHVRIDRLKGVTCGFNVTQPNVLLRGPMGSGKTAVIDGIMLALDLPTAHGSTGHDRLGVNGSWSASLQFDDDNVRLVERRCTAGRTAFFLNGVKATRADYVGALQSILAVDPHHVDLGSFIGLSGQKRAALFGAMLDGEAVLLDKVLNWRRALFNHGIDLNAEATTRLMERLAAMGGTLTELTDGLREIANECSGAERDARAQLQGLIDRQAGVSGGQSPAELKQAIRDIDEQLGSLRSKKDDAERAAEQHRAAQKLVDAVSKDHQAAARQRDMAKDEAAKLTALQGEHAELLKTLDDVVARIKRNDETSDELRRKSAIVAEGLASLRANEAILRRMSDADSYEVDRAWLTAEAAELLDAMGIEAEVDLDDDQHAAVVRFAVEVVRESFGGTLDRVRGQLEEAAQQSDRMKLAIKEGASEAEAAFKESDGLKKRIAECEAAIQRSEAARDGLPELEEKVAQLDLRRAEQQQQAQQTAPMSDEKVDVQIASLQEARASLDAQLTALEEARAISGQIEEQRADVISRQTIKDSMNLLVQEVQRRRDESLSKSIANVMGPFIERFALLFGGTAQIVHQCSGAGRSTAFDFLVRRPPHDVPLDLLSGGETVLAAAAFLASLQAIKSGPGSILALNTEGLDEGGLQRLLAGAPKLGLDHVFIANNQVEEIDLEGWQSVDMSAPPKE